MDYTQYRADKSLFIIAAAILYLSIHKENNFLNRYNAMNLTTC